MTKGNHKSPLARFEPVAAKMRSWRLKRQSAVCILAVAFCLLNMSRQLWPFRESDSPEAGRTRNLPECIIFGVKKAGTRALLEFLNLHPDVETPHDEIDFFNVDSEYARGLDWYRSQMPPVKEGQMTIEKSPHYFNSKKAPERIFAMNKSIKLIVAVREPVERSVSDFLQSYAMTNVSYESLAFRDRGFDEVNERWSATVVSQYGVHMEEWVRVFPAKQILVVEGAALVADPAGQMQRVEKFLGLRPFFSNDTFYFDPNKGFMCAKREGTSGCLGKNKGRKHPELNPHAVETLRKHFARSNRQLYSQIGENYKWPEW